MALQLLRCDQRSQRLLREQGIQDVSQAQKLDARRSPKPTATLRLKLLLGYGGTLTASVLLVLWSLISLQELGEASGAILSENYRSIAATNAMNDAIARQERIVGIFEAQARQASVSLTSKVPDDLPDVRVDATKISWVLSNLVSNALRYTSESGAIEIAAIRAGRHVHFSVRDTGVGIPPDVQGRVFDKFVRVGPDKSSAGGTGLGLAICKEIVRAHGGTIWVDSTPGKGSTFTFTVPVDPQGEQR